MDIEKETFSSCNRASKSQPLSQKQKDTLIEYVYARPDMYKGTFSPTFTYATSVMLWKQVADILNSIPGSKKDWKQWRKTFVDIKKNAKSKLSKQKKHSQGTGKVKDDYPKEDTNTDTKILEIITPVAIDGNKDVPIRQTFDYTENDASTDINNIEIDDKREDQPGTSKDQSTPKKPHTLINVTKSRSSKSNRLEKSLRNNKEFLQVTTEGNQATEIYREKKLELMQKNYLLKKKTL